MAYLVEPKKGNVTIVRVLYDGPFKQDFLLTADKHWDNVLSNRRLQKKHLNEAMDRQAGILDFGDFFCAMQGKYDKRSSKDAVRREHMTGDYLDKLVETAIEWHAPWAELFIRIGKGNHELSIKSKHETDLIARLVAGLNGRCRTDIHVGGFSGWVQFRFEDTRKQRTKRINLWYMHGFGGGGPVTKGTIQTARRAAYVPDAAIICTGHIHEEWTLTTARDRINHRGKQYKDEQLHVQIPTYKDEYKDGQEGWSVEGGTPPKPIGAKWLTFSKTDPDGPIMIDTTRAK